MSEPPPPATLPRYRHVESHEHIEDDPLVSLNIKNISGVKKMALTGLAPLTTSTDVFEKRKALIFNVVS